MNKDFKEVPLSRLKGKIDLIFTDPPYPKQFSHLFNNLALLSQIVLKEGGSVVFICPHYLLPKVVNDFEKTSLKYRWIINMCQMTGSHARMLMGIEVCWKPMLWYVKGAYPSGRGFLRDAIEITEPNKELHIWEQDISWANYYIPRLCPKDGTVFDPMMGAGTTGVVCKKYNLNYIGCEIDKETFGKAKNRIDEYKSVERISVDG